MGIEARFEKRFGISPRLVVFAPGRVNIVGEHTDYSLLPVLPMGIEQGVTLAIAPSDTGIVEGSSPRFGIDVSVGRGDPRPEGWGRYLWGVVQTLGWSRGMRFLVESDLPAAGGLASSSALTVALVAALAEMGGGGLDREAIIAAASRAERMVGIEGGTMDQTVIVSAEEGNALRIEFDPPSHHQVAIPDEVRLLVAHCGRDAPKAGPIGDAYDQRVVGCRLAAGLLSAALQQPPATHLGAVAGVSGVADAAAGLPERATPGRAARAIGIDRGNLCQLTSRSWDPDREVPVRACALHVLSEAERVDAAVAALSATDLPALGAILGESHRSLRHFGVGSEELDELVAAMVEAGAAGARPTGAGFGGFAVAAVEADAVRRVIEAGRRTGGGAALEVRASGGLRW